ncbi:MAG: HD domain-containing protein [Patescibacteria group bacterium]|nr:HD domain-containing protein [Patescibacteria group bacterium]
MTETELYKKVEKFIEESFKENAPYRHTPIHLKLTAECLRELEPNPNEALLIAAVSHDIDRAFINHKFEKEFNNPDYLDYHQTTCAKIISDYLNDLKTDPRFIKEVANLISKHEIGGNKEENLLKDADSLSFFKGKGYLGIIKRFTDNPSKVQRKVDWMYNRITSKKAKELAKPFYEDAIRKLEESKK